MESQIVFFSQHAMKKIHVVNLFIYLVLSKKLTSFTIVTLALGSRTKQGFAKVWAKNETHESYFILSGV
jgi:hypothetical protein